MSDDPACLDVNAEYALVDWLAPVIETFVLLPILLMNSGAYEVSVMSVPVFVVICTPSHVTVFAVNAVGSPVSLPPNVPATRKPQKLSESFGTLPCKVSPVIDMPAVTFLNTAVCMR